MAFLMKGPGQTCGYVYNVEQAVGKTGVNATADVKLVQYLLRGIYGAQAAGLAVDGWIGPTTISWIEKFQKEMKAKGVNLLTDGRVDRAFAATSTVSKTIYTILVMNTELEKRNPPAWAALPTQVALNPHPRPNPYNPVRKDVVAFRVTPYSNDQYEVNMTYSDGSMATYLVRGQFFIKGQAFDTNSPDLISASTFKENGKLYVTYLYRNGKQQTVEIPAAA
ncbi:MAG: hypothetical protein IT162_00610 [Bryobacterales bacterium]|nr:hypothetical protein [Bryobacterales bacterium]